MEWYAQYTLVLYSCPSGSPVATRGQGQQQMKEVDFVQVNLKFSTIF